MNRPHRIFLAFVVISVAGFSGCQPTQPIYLGEDGDLSHYLDSATEVSYPDVDEASLDEVTLAQAPFTLGSPEVREFWDLSLEDVISIALQNTKVVRGGQAPILQGWAVTSPGNDQLLSSTDPRFGSSSFRTVFNPAVEETEIGTAGHRSSGVRQSPTGLGPSNLRSAEAIENSGAGGVENALAEFDAHFSSEIFWDKSDRPRNFDPGNTAFTPILQEDSATFVAEVKKKTANGTHLFFRNVTDYDYDHQFALNPLRALASAYTTAFEMEARQPLLRGRGTMVNRIGVITARIDSDQEIAGLEEHIQNFVANLEVRYWDLHCAYRALEATKTGRDSALVSWRDTEVKARTGASNTQEEAQTREQYLFFRSQVESALCDLYSAENDLRWLMGLAATDGRLIRPVDEPTQAKIDFDWQAIHAEAIVRRPKLRSQRWQLKKRELLLAYAKNALLPEVNAVALYRWLGVGDNLIGANRNGINFPNPASRAADELTEGNYQEARFGVEFNMPIGFRRELAGVRNQQLKLARDRAFLEDMELDASRELTQAVRAMDAHYQLAQTHFNRWIAAEREVEGRLALVKGGTATLADDLLLDAHRRRADAQIAYYRALCEYSKAIALVHRRKGSILDYCGIQFGEGPWPEKAYFDALGHARRRDASRYMNYGWSRPNVVSTGSEPLAPSEIPEAGTIIDEILMQQPTLAEPEQLPAGDAGDDAAALLPEPAGTGVVIISASDEE